MNRLVALLVLGLVACEGSPSGAGADIAKEADFQETLGDGGVPSDPLVAPDSLGLEEVQADLGKSLDELEPLTGPAFYGPTGLALSGELVVVANSEFDGVTMSYGPGSVTFVRRHDLAPVARMPTSRKNPAAVAISGSTAFVLCAGETSFDSEKGLVLPKSDGALDVFDLTFFETGPKVSIPVPIDPSNPLIGYPSSLALSPDGKRAWAGSGTAAVIFEFDLVTSKLVRTIALGDLDRQDGITLEVGQDGRIWAGSFNRDQVYAFLPSDPASRSAFTVGKSPSDMDGVVDIALRPGASPDVFALLAMSSSISAIDSTTGKVKDAFATTGLYPNRMARGADFLYVVNSGDNNVLAVNADTGKSDVVAVLPEKTNPWDIAVDGPSAFVTGNGSNSLFLVDIKAGKVVGEAK